MERVQEIFYLETFDIKNRMKDSPDMMIGVDSGRLLCKLNKICGNSKKREQIEIICKYLENENGRSKKEIYIPMPVKDAVQCFGERDLAKLPKSTFRVWESTVYKGLHRVTV